MAEKNDGKRIPQFFRIRWIVFRRPEETLKHCCSRAASLAHQKRKRVGTNDAAERGSKMIGINV